MITTKEKVLAYFREWAGKGANPANGVRIWEQSKRLWNIMRDVPKGSVHLYHVMDYEDSPADDFRFEIAARILNLDPPMAAPIVWKEEHMGFISDCGLYRITKGAMGGVWIDFRHAIDFAFCGTCCDLFVANPETVEDSKSHCQVHKQNRFNKLGGYNV